MKFNFKRKRTFRKFLSLFMCCLLDFGAVMGTVAITKTIKEDTKVIRPLFSVGGLDDSGKFKSTTASIYTKDAFECKGLSVKLDFDSNVKYQAFYYNKLGEFVSKSEVFTKSNEFTLPSGVTHARFVIYPIWSADVDKEDRVCHWYDVSKYSSQIEIRVLKEQGTKKGNIINSLTFTEDGYKRNSTYTMNADAIAASGYVSTIDPVDISDVDSVRIYVPAGGIVSYIFYTNTGTSMNSKELVVDGTSGEVTETIDLPLYAEYVHFNFSIENLADVYDYAIYVN